VAVGLLVADEEFDIGGELVDAVALADEETLLGETGVVAVDVAEAVPVDVAEAVDVAAGVVLEQLGSGLGLTPSLPTPSEVVLVVVLVLGLGLGDVWGVVVGVWLGLRLVPGVTLALGLLLALAEALALELPVLPLLALPLDDVVGAVAVPVALLGELLLVSVTAGCVDDDEQGLAVVCVATPGALGDGSAAAEGAGVALWPSVAPAALEELLLVKAWLMVLLADTSAERAGGTTDRTTPMANTAAPTAKAGRSIASRQSLGRCGSRRCGVGRWDAGRCDAGRCDAGRPSRPRRRTSPAAKPEIASQTPSAPLGWLARDGRDRILSRIRSRPFAPGST
jgi:uncharacterized low-complexity protein